MLIFRSKIAKWLVNRVCFLISSSVTRLVYWIEEYAHIIHMYCSAWICNSVPGTLVNEAIILTHNKLCHNDTQEYSKYTCRKCLINKASTYRLMRDIRNNLPYQSPGYGELIMTVKFVQFLELVYRRRRRRRKQLFVIAFYWRFVRLSEVLYHIR